MIFGKAKKISLLGDPLPAPFYDTIITLYNFFRKFPFISTCRGVVALSPVENSPEIQKRVNNNNMVSMMNTHDDEDYQLVLRNTRSTPTLFSNILRRQNFDGQIGKRGGNILFSKILRKQN